MQNRIVTVTGGSAEDPTSKAYAVPLSLDRPPRLLGSVDLAFPSLTPGRVWLYWNRKQEDGSYRPLLRQVDLRGRQIASYEIPEGRDLTFPAATEMETGILTYFSEYDEDDPSNRDDYGFYVGGGAETYLEVWEPANNKTVRRLDLEADLAGQIIAADRRTAAFHQSFPIGRTPGETDETKPPACGTRCPIHLVDVVTGKHRQVVLPAGIKGVQADALFSPDGRSLAVNIEDLADSPEAVFAGSLFIIDIATGRATKIFNASDIAHLGSWSPDGRWLFFSHNDQLHQPGRIGVYRLGDGHAKSLDLRMEQTSPLLAIPSRFIR